VCVCFFSLVLVSARSVPVVDRSCWSSQCPVSLDLKLTLYITDFIGFRDNTC
jgi:hypothetical protein